MAYNPLIGSIYHLYTTYIQPLVNEQLSVLLSVLVCVQLSCLSKREWNSAAEMKVAAATA